MPILLIIAGLILLIALPSLFAGAAAVGGILLAAGALWLLFGFLAYRKVRKMQKSMFKEFNSPDPFGRVPDPLDRKPFDLNDFRRH